MFAKRQKVGAITGLLLSLVFGFLLVLVSTVDLFMAQRLSADTPLSLTVRIPTIGVYRDTMTGGSSYHIGAVRKGRGETLDPQTLRLVQTYEAQRRPPSTALLVGLGLGILLLFLLYSTYLRMQGGAAALVRTQLVLFICLLAMAVVSKVLLVGTAWSSLWIPLSVLVIPVAMLLGHRVGGATAVVGACMASLLTPVDLPLLVVLLVQGLTAALSAAHPERSKGRMILAALFAAGGSFACYGAITLLLQQYVPLGLFQSPLQVAQLLGSDLVASIGSPLLCGVFAVVIVPAVERALGQVSKARLVALAEFESPLLKRLASIAPGTWAHSLSMANMAEMAANAIGANALLVRVGAYYHDIGKTAQPEYFIENQEGTNPHDELGPEVSADAIFAHVTEGAKLCRKHKIPAPVTEFVYTHHGNGLLEFFWHKAMREGNPQESTESDFRYPGIRPQNRETGILSLCDAVEAASKSIKDPDMEQIRRMVRQIVFSKLEQGMLDESGLTIADLRKSINSLVETLRSSMHVRVKYPWQEAEDRRAADDRQEAEDRQTADDTQTADRVPEPEEHTRDGLGDVQPGAAANDDREQLHERRRVRTRPLGKGFRE